VNREQKDRLQVLMVRLADGDRTAFEPIYEALWPVVRRFAERTLAGSPDAEDAAQVAFMKVFARVSEFDPRRDAVTWVLGVAAHECRTFRQKQRRRREDPASDGERPAGDPSPEDSALVRDLDAALVEVLGDLAAGDAATLRAVLDEQPPAIAAATFRKRVERALARLRTAWSSRHGID
jgi:RNA polymerase sigma-70 factor (ECF subfamily)